MSHDCLLTTTQSQSEPTRQAESAGSLHEVCVIHLCTDSAVSLGGSKWTVNLIKMNGVRYVSFQELQYGGLGLSFSND